jgi:tetratricopeptide (TPR) repeat protein
MVQVFISHSGKDDEFVGDLANFLEEGGEIETFVDHHDIHHGEHFVSRIESGLHTDAVLVILSPDALRSKWVKKEYEGALASDIPLAPVLCRDCTPPVLLLGLHRFDATKNRLDEFPKIKAWLLLLRPPVPLPFHAPARPPLFIGRVAELDALRTRLAEEGSVVPVEGLAGLGKTTLALEFVHRHKRDFEAVYWLQCVGRDLASLASDLASQLGVALEGDLEKILDHLRKHCARKRCLLVLDNVEDERPGQLIPNGRASVLVTTRREYLAFLGHGGSVKPELFTEEECFILFRDVLGEKDVAKSEASAKLLFERLGYLPIAISVAAGLIKHDVHYSIDSLAKKLPPLGKLAFGKDNVGVLLKDAIAALGDNERRLLTAMAVCAPDGFRLSLAAEVAELPEEASLDALQELKSRSLADELDRESRRYRLHALVRTAAEPSDSLRLRHAEAVSKLFDSWESNWRERQHDLGDLREAVDWTLEGGTDEQQWRLSDELGHKGYSLTKRIGRLPEAYELSERLARAAQASGNKWALQKWYQGQAMILQAWGRQNEALTLYEKQEAICEELGDRDGLQRSYGNQALILQVWGRLDEALTLHKKEEAICEELGDRDGLQASYGNQALILTDWGRLDEALALLKKQEAICEELENRLGLQATYGNQAIVLQAWGRLDEALALLKKQEAVCQNLGNRDGLQASYGNQARILQAWGRLDEALALLQTQESICKGLGKLDGLAFCNWAMADLARQRGDRNEARMRADAALSIFTELKMPHETEGVKKLFQKISTAEPPSS